MLTMLIRGVLHQPRLVLLVALLLSIWAAVRLQDVEYEVFPEFVPAQASIQVEAPGMSAGQIELLVTQPLEQIINGATGIAAVRSRSIQGLAVIDVIFRDGEDPYRARQVVAERLAEGIGALPQGISVPTLSPLTSSTMDLLKIGFTSDSLAPMALRDIVQWTVRPQLLSVSGVARVTIFGGEARRIEVRVRNADLVARGLRLADVALAVQTATGVRGGGFVDTEAQRILIEPRGSAVDPVLLAAAPLHADRSDPGLKLADVADVMEGVTPPFGDALIMGRPGVLIALASQFGANTLTTTLAVEQALAELRPALAAQGVTVHPALHRPANFIESARRGMGGDLLTGAILITLVLLVMTRSLKLAFIALVSIPLSLLAAVTALVWNGAPINTMILGGFAVALGVVIDDAIIGIENILRRLRSVDGRSRFDVVLDAVVEVRAPVVHATFVLALTVLPVLLLTGLQGAFFAPLALAFLVAVLTSLLVAVTITPALAMVLLQRSGAQDEPGFLQRARQWHMALVHRLCAQPRRSMLITALLGLIAIIGFAGFGAELLPAFRERHFVLQVNGPSGASLPWMRALGERLSAELLAIDGIATVEQQIGRTAAGEDTFPPSRSEFHVELDAVDAAAEETVLRQIRKVLSSWPGIGYEALTFLGDRIGESLSGETAAIAIGIFGPDLDQLDAVAMRIARTVRAIEGAVDVQVASTPGTPAVVVTLNPARLVERGVNAADAYEVIEAAYQGIDVTQVQGAGRITPVALTLSGFNTRDPEAVGSLQMISARGAVVSLRDVAAIDLVESRAEISHEGGRRRQVVTANAETRDIAGLEQAIRAAVDSQVVLPEGVYLQYGGAAVGEALARTELITNVTFAAAGVVILLVLALGGARPAVLILAGTPAALAGGVLAVMLVGDGVVSLGALVGFVTLFGIAARNAILLVAHTDHLIEHEGETFNAAAITRAAGERMTPVLMTALVTALGMLPLAIGTGEAGREVQGPMALVILGGLITSTVFSLLILPPLILAFRHGRTAHTNTGS